MSVWQSIVFAFWLLLHFLLYGVLDATVKVSPVACAIFAAGYACIVLNFFPLYNQTLTFIVMVLACFFQMEINLSQVLAEAKHPQNVYAIVLVLFFVVMQFSEAMQTEADSMYDSFVMVVLVGVYLFQRGNKEQLPRTARSLTKYFAAIVICTKAAYFLDREKSLNFIQDETMSYLKSIIQTDERL